MTVSQLIAELQRLPAYCPVSAVLGSVFIADELGEQIVPLGIDDALEVTDVRFEGNQVMLWADGMHR